MTKEIPLTQGKVALVNDTDHERLMQWKWKAFQSKSGTWYACRREDGRAVMMHRVIMNAPAGVSVDHRDGDGLHNCRKNLRACTHAQNMHNRKIISKNNTSGYKGIFRVARKWRAIVRHNGKNVHVGYFNTKIDAAKAYDKKAKELFGDFARPNFK